MRCPRCHQEIKSRQRQCNYCGTEIERNLIRRLLDRLAASKIDERKFAETLASGNLPAITSARELELYLKHTIGDEEFAVLLTEILVRIGKDGCVEIKRGGDGNPYEVEYKYSELPNHMSRKEIAERVEQLRQVLSQENPPAERDKLQEELAQLAGAKATVWVNSSSQGVVDKANLLLEKSIKALSQLSK